MRDRLVLAGDIGGTNIRLALYRYEQGTLLEQRREIYATGDFSRFEEVVALFLKQTDFSTLDACFGVPGPVIDGKACTPNLAWVFEERQIAQTLGLASLTLVNDLVVLANALPYLTEDELLCLHAGVAENKAGIRALLAPGTGLGQAFISSTARGDHVFSSEGGHVDFAPTTEIETELLCFLHKRLDRVSYEHILSGPGLVNIYSFLKDKQRSEGPGVEPDEDVEYPTPEVISHNALFGLDPFCVQALDIFASALGSQAGNLVLTLMAMGGVFIGGGIATKIQQKLVDGTVVASYLDKGYMSLLVRQTPLYLILDSTAALKGAASIAARASEEQF
ncbi:glucokinase [candidate division CSSED10-310 bacterium]|uniref:Glucokinase n=1 Tax=candidate division CSSED10-310 bacterium TaxID=2855610 RepID=A0ABV6YRC5_UNCC1